MEREKSHQDDDGSYEGEESGGPSANKSERKRQREKDRRKEMAEGFVELAQLLAQVEPDEVDSPAKKKKRGGSDDGYVDPDSSGMTRIDLISRAIDTIRKLHAQNLELKKRSRGDEDKEVLVMVPTLQLSSGNGHGPQPGGHASALPPASYQHYYSQPPISSDPRNGPQPPQHSNLHYYHSIASQSPPASAQESTPNHSMGHPAPAAGNYGYHPSQPPWASQILPPGHHPGTGYGDRPAPQFLHPPYPWGPHPSTYPPTMYSQALSASTSQQQSSQYSTPQQGASSLPSSESLCVSNQKQPAAGP